MASFLSRALDLDPTVPPPRLPEVSPDPAVVIGTENWLYLNETVDQTCLDASVYERLIAEIDKTKAVVAASGRSFTYAVAPNKAVVYSGTVPGSVWNGSCADRNSDLLHAALAAANDSDRVELLAPFAAADPQLFFKHDTHWNVNGSLLGSELIAGRAAAGVWDQTDLVASPASRQGDLAGVIGVDWVEEYDEMTPTLAGVEPTVTVESIAIAGRPLVSYSSSGSPELAPLRTAVIHDSFGLFFRNKLGPLFEDVTFVPTFSHPITDAARPFVFDSEQIVIEIVERNALRDFIATGTAGHLAAALADDFAQTPVAFNRAGDEFEFTIPGGASGDLRYLVVEADVTSTVIIGDLKDVDIADDEGAWPNEISPDASRYGFEIVGSGGTIRLPLPGAVDVTAAFVVVVE